MAQVDEGSLQLTGKSGFLPELVKRVLEAGLQAKLTDHLGYEKHDRAGHGSGNSRNGFTGKRLGTEVGDVDPATPRDRNGSFEPRLVPKGQRRVGGLSDMIISLCAGGMTIRDIQAHLERTLGTELANETIANITDAVGEEVKAWQARPWSRIHQGGLSQFVHDEVRGGPRLELSGATMDGRCFGRVPCSTCPALWIKFLNGYGTTGDSYLGRVSTRSCSNALLSGLLPTPP